MSLTRRVAHNTIIQVAGKIISLVLGVATVALLTRYLGQFGFGEYTTITAFLQTAAILADMGLALMMLQMISKITDKKDEEKLIGNFLGLRVISSLIFLGLSVLVALLIPTYSLVIKVGIAIVAISFLFSALIQVLTGIFQKNLHMERTVIAEVFGRIILLGCTWFAVAKDLGLCYFLLAMILGNIANFFLLLCFSKKFVRINFQIDFKVWKRILKECWPVALSIAFSLVYFKADTIILSLTRPQNEVGVYGATYRVLEIAIVFPILFINLVLPFLTQSWAIGNRERFKNILQKSFDFLVIVAMPMVAGTLFFAKRLMTLIAGQEFGAAGSVLQILIVATAIIFVGNFFGHVIVAIDKQKAMIKYYALTAIVGLGGYLIFIPRYSYFGAAYMTIAAELIIAISAFAIVWRTTKIVPKFSIIWKSLFSSLIMSVSLYFLKSWNFFALAVIASAVYFIALYLVKGISKEMIREIVK